MPLKFKFPGMRFPSSNIIVLKIHKTFFFSAEYKVLCPGGEGFRPNPITVILEGNTYYLNILHVYNDKILW